jgi:hypothetical protein
MFSLIQQSIDRREAARRIRMPEGQTMGLATVPSLLLGSPSRPQQTVLLQMERKALQSN